MKAPRTLRGLAAQLRARIAGNRGYADALGTAYGLIGANIVVQLLLVPLYLATLDSYRFGILMILLAVFGYAAVGLSFITGGMARILGEFHARDDAEGFRRGYLVSKLVYGGYALVVGIVVSAAVFAFEGVLFEVRAGYRETVLLTVLAGALYFVLLYDFSVDRLALIAKGRQAAANLLSVLSVLVFAALVVPWLLAGGDLPGVMVCMVAGVVVARLGAHLYWRRLGIALVWRRDALADRATLRRLVGRSGAAFTLYGVLLLTLRADVIIVGWLGGAEMAALFVLVWKIAEVGIDVLARIPETFSPFIIHMDARGEAARLGRTYAQSRRWMTAIALGAGLGYAALGPYVVALWVGPSYAPDDRLAYVLAGGAIFWLALARLPAVYAFAMVRLRALVWISLVEVAGKLALTVALFDWAGYLAPLIAINVMHVGGVALGYAALRRTFLDDDRAAA